MSEITQERNRREKRIKKKEHRLDIITRCPSKSFRIKDVYQIYYDNKAVNLIIISTLNLYIEYESRIPEIHTTSP